MPAGLIDSYPLAVDRYDEMLAAPGKPRAHWQRFADRLTALPDEAMNRREQFVRSAIEADGVTYNVYSDPKGVKRPWELDMLPLIIDADEWARLGAAVAQRARLFNAMLADLYGERRLLTEGLLPPALVFGQHGYEWPCLGVQPPAGIWLHSYAVDLARAPDGQWWAIADRTQGPSGAGYALQNRIIISRTFPDAFRELQVQPLAGFFRSIQDSLARLAPTDGEAPLCVLLTPGPYNETYFEHAFLARYLGFPLVEGQDLTVRDDTVYLKTLRGLRRHRRTFPPELLPLVHLLVFDTTNPHSVGFQVEALQRYLARTARELGHPYPAPMIDPLARRLADFDLTRFEADECDLAVHALRTLLAEAQEAAGQLSDEIHRHFFTHTVHPMHLRSVA